MKSKKSFLPAIGGALLVIILSGCGSPEATSKPALTKETPPATSPTPESPTATPIPSTSTPTPNPPTATPTPDLSGRPLIWFAPLPPLSVQAGRPFIGAEDYMDLFLPDAPWQETADRIHVLGLYGEWVHDASWTQHASDEELKQVIEFANQKGLALAIEASPLARPDNCGVGYESWGGFEIGLDLMERIHKLGGTVYFISMDAPYYYSSVINDPGACQWPAKKVAGEVEAFIKKMKRVYPDVVIGDTEPMQAWLDAAIYQEWMVTFREVSGYNMPFFHMDIDYSSPGWAEKVKALEDFAKQEGIEFGILYFGSWNDLSDEAWLANTGERVKLYELLMGGRPDHVLFQSWHDHPDFSLPDSDPYTYTGFVKRYLDDKSTLGFRREGPGANVAVGKMVRVSKSLPYEPGENAVDGNPDTLWGAGDFAPQWIEIDLGMPYSIAEIRLRLSQSPAGATEHRVYAKKAGKGEQFTLIFTFEGETHDLEQLVHTLPEPIEGIQYIQLASIRSPSWIGFREIEVISAK